NEPFNEFTQSDYLNYVDGKPRYKGVASFLESRGIDLPWGSPEDSTDEETVCGLGNRKNEAFNEVLKREGAEVYPSSEKLLFELKDAGVKLGVASSSKNCKAVLEAVDLLHLFGTRVDGVVSAELGLQGKPEPDIFTTACENLGVKPENSIVVEDAVSGVQAGAKGGFGLTLGIAREGNVQELQNNGADYVVTNLEEVNGVKGLNELFLKFRKKQVHP
ncbi:HAD family hydrolase, partial [Mariniphaga sp.]|uniref:HAD family hydrolase n=1 Tax=Mariniphaga sp. TaxID=1954475 RepID=UPI003563A8E7